MLTITHDGGRKTYLEFFAAGADGTLIKKRASFLVNRQQVKDPPSGGTVSTAPTT
ncbi:MAG: hypothetical protein IPL75_16050 [Acidobacteria bacterium]|nr:hypothetical protein [Acidobacteriota bacterium]